MDSSNGSQGLNVYRDLGVVSIHIEFYCQTVKIGGGVGPAEKLIHSRANEQYGWVHSFRTWASNSTGLVQIIILNPILLIDSRAKYHDDNRRTMMATISTTAEPLSRPLR